MHLRKQFEEWYANEVSKQGPDLQAVSLSLLLLREKGAKWITNAAAYISDNPQIVINGNIIVYYKLQNEVGIDKKY